MRLLVKYLDGSEAEVVRTASALRAFEQKHKMALPAVIGTGQSWWADELAHHSLLQSGLTDVEDFDEWLDTVETVLWQRDAVGILAVADLFGYAISDAERQAIVGTATDPTHGAEAAASRADS